MNNNKIVFMGTPKIASIYLKSLIESKHNLVAVFSQPPRKRDRGMELKESPVHKLAIKYGIDVYTPYDFVSANIPDVMKEIHDKGELSDDIKKKLDEALKTYKGTFGK